MNNRKYMAIDLKSFYASVECVERKLEPLTTNLVVADASRTDKTICLAVTPSLKSYGISGRPRLFEVVQKVKEINASRLSKAPGRVFYSASYDDIEVKSSPNIALDYIIAPPRMACYLDISTQIYQIYLKYISPEDIHVYSIDEVFIDITNYLNIYKYTAREFAEKIISDVLKSTGITASAGIGTNLYLAKIAMDIQAKRIPSDKNGLKIAELDEKSYRHLLWSHRPLTDFWRIGNGYSEKLEKRGIFTMGDIARCSMGNSNEYHNEDLLYKLFGINAELLIDHAWGWEPCTIADIKAYKPKTNSISSGQVLQYGYTFEKAKLIAREMTELLVLGLVDQNLVTDQIVLRVGYDSVNMKKTNLINSYNGEIKIDSFGRYVPKSDHGSINLGKYTSSTKLIIDKVTELFDHTVNKNLLIKRVNITANHIVDEKSILKIQNVEQLNVFTDSISTNRKKEVEEKIQREKNIQKAILEIKNKYGKNAILKGMNFETEATTMDRNNQIGGHKA